MNLLVQDNPAILLNAHEPPCLSLYQPTHRQRLIRAALPQHHHLFGTVSRDPYLMDEAIDAYPDALLNDALREGAWQLVQPYHLERLAGFVEELGAAQPNGRGEDDRLIPGRIDATSGAIVAGDQNDPEIDDGLDDLGEYVHKSGGDVIIVPTERMPTQTRATAIYRF